MVAKMLSSGLGNALDADENDERLSTRLDADERLSGLGLHRTW